MTLDQLCYDVFFDLFICVLGNAEPVFLKRVRISWAASELAGYKDDFEFSPVEVVTDNDLMSVSVNCTTSFRNEEFWIRFQLSNKS
jgi:hypothetical protein